MIRKMVPVMVIALLVISGSAFADIFITPYGSYNFFNGLSTEHTLDVDTGLDFFPPASVDNSQLDNALGGGVVIGTRSENSGLVLALNLEYMTGSTNELFVVYDDFDQDYTIGEMKIESPAIAVGGFVGVVLSGISSDKWQSVTGLEMGVIKPTGSITFKYHEFLPDPIHIKTETYDFSESSLYLSFLFTQTYSFGDFLGLSGTLGWRSVDSKIEPIETAAMSGGYGQQYGGFFMRLGLDLDF